jgi:hypothetical protein
MRMRVMGSPSDRTERIEALRGLIERLSAPDLTLTEAKVLRGRLSDLLQRDNEPAGWDRPTVPPTALASRGRGDGSWHDDRSHGTSMRAAG